MTDDYTSPKDYTDKWWTGETPVATLHLNAGNDVNGNPRRAYVAIGAAGHIIGVADEGYSGREGTPWPIGGDAPYDVSIQTTPGEYRAYLTRIERNRGRWAVGDDFGMISRHWTKAKAQKAARGWHKPAQVVDLLGA